MGEYVLEFLGFSALLVVPLGIYFGVASSSELRRRATVESRYVVLGSLVGYLGLGLMLCVFDPWLGALAFPIIAGAIGLVLGGLAGFGCARAVRLVDRIHSRADADFAEDQDGNPVRMKPPG